jgi:hypothetical protein
VRVTVATGRTRLLGLGDYGHRAMLVRAELGVQPRRGPELGPVLQVSHHDVLWFELQADEGRLLVPGDLDLAQLGLATRWPLREGAFQPTLRAELGVAAWRSPVEPQAWRDVAGDQGLLVPTEGLGAWTSTGVDLAVEVEPEGPSFHLGPELGYIAAGPISGLTVSLRLGFSAHPGG